MASHKSNKYRVRHWWNTSIHTFSIKCTKFYWFIFTATPTHAYTSQNSSIFLSRLQGSDSMNESWKSSWTQQSGSDLCCCLTIGLSVNETDSITNQSHSLCCVHAQTTTKLLVREKTVMMRLWLCSGRSASAQDNSSHLWLTVSNKVFFFFRARHDSTPLVQMPELKVAHSPPLAVPAFQWWLGTSCISILS